MHLPVCVLHTGTLCASPLCLPVEGKSFQASATQQDHCIPCCRRSAHQQQLAATSCRRAEGPAGGDRPCRPATHPGADAAAAAALRAHCLQGWPGVTLAGTDAGSISCMAQPQRHVLAGETLVHVHCAKNERLLLPGWPPPALKLTVCTAASGCRASACCPACSTLWLQLTSRHCWERRTACCSKQLLA